MNYNEKVFELHDQGVTPGKIAQRLKIKKAEVLDILGNAADKGLGDKVEKFTEATGIKAAVEAIMDDCGCAARKEKLNELFPTRKLNDLSIEDHAWLTDFFASKPKSVRSDQQKVLVDIYNRIFNSKRVVSNCSPCVANLMRELELVYVKANS